jgi:hypothetical protein
MTSEKVFLRRKDGRYGKPKEISVGDRMFIGSFMNNSRPAITLKITGATEEDEFNKKLLSDFLSINVTDPQFKHEVEEFYKNIRIEVGPGDDDLSGTPLEIGLIDGYPINVEDYISYQHAMKHPYVTTDYDRFMNEQHILYYIEKPKEKQERRVEEIKLADEAKVKLIMIKQNEPDKINTILEYFLMVPELMTDDEKIIALDDIARRKAQELMSIVDDPKLEIKALVEQLISKEIIQKVEDEYFYKDLRLGASIDQVVKAMQNPKNAVSVNTMRAANKHVPKDTID